MIFWNLFFTFFKIGAFTFGGGYAMIPLIQAEVLSKGWASEETLINFIAISESTPGPFAVNISTYIGAELAGVLGALCATLGVVLPSFLIILLVAKFFEKFKNNAIVSGCMSGLKPATIGLIGAAVVSIGKTVFFPDGLFLQVVTQPRFYASLAIFAVMSVLAFRKVHPIAIVGLSALAGVLTGFFV